MWRLVLCSVILCYFVFGVIWCYLVSLGVILYHFLLCTVIFVSFDVILCYLVTVGVMLRLVLFRSSWCHFAFGVMWWHFVLFLVI